MSRAFPNQLDQNEVIQLANKVAPDLSITFGASQYGGPSNIQAQPSLLQQGQFQHHPLPSQPHHYHHKHVAPVISPYYYTPNPCCCCHSRWR